MIQVIVRKHHSELQRSDSLADICSLESRNGQLEQMVTSEYLARVSDRNIIAMFASSLIIIHGLCVAVSLCQFREEYSRLGRGGTCA